MFCKRGWGTEFMAANFPLTFRRSTLRKHRRKILVEREKALLPSMQVFVEYKKEAAKYLALAGELRAAFGNRCYRDFDVEAYNKTVSGRYALSYSKKYRLQNELRDTHILIKELKERLDKTEEGSPLDKELLQAIQDAKRKRSDLMHKVKLAEEEYEVIHAEYVTARETMEDAGHAYLRYRNMYDGIEAGDRQKREFIMKCADEECRGFLSTAYKCGTCEKWTCPDCLVVIGLEKDATHICDANTVESAKAIKAETRGCPKCATRIFKIDGCDQMWCVMEGCGTAFSWNTGQIATGKVHNPHYYEWLRRTGGTAPREVGDIPCGGLPSVYDMMSSLWVHDESYHTLLETHRNINELIELRLPQHPCRAPQLANKDLDVEYLTNKIDTAAWERGLELSEAKFNRKREIGQILQTLATASADILRQIVNQAHLQTVETYPSWILESIQELNRLRMFGNESLQELSKRDHIAVPQLGEQWKWTPIRALWYEKKTTTLV
ncbi:hypothetical protein EBR66_07130 [bacterium]|nr:hypothetical protein [bacterium]